jgi:hypothetical protein
MLSIHAHARTIILIRSGYGGEGKPFQELCKESTSVVQLVLVGFKNAPQAKIFHIRHTSAQKGTKTNYLSSVYNRKRADHFRGYWSFCITSVKSCCKQKRLCGTLLDRTFSRSKAFQALRLSGPLVIQVVTAHLPQ